MDLMISSMCHSHQTRLINDITSLSYTKRIKYFIQGKNTIKQLKIDTWSLIPTKSQFKILKQLQKIWTKLYKDDDIYHDIAFTHSEEGELTSI